MLKEHSVLDTERLRFAQSVIARYGACIAPASRQAILRQQIVLGMPPYEASLAGGAHSLEVVADPARAPEDADSAQVIAAQSLHPDNSQIICIFQNATQFPERGSTRFRVIFRMGRAIDIEPMT